LQKLFVAAGTIGCSGRGIADPTKHGANDRADKVLVMRDKNFESRTLFGRRPPGRVESL